MKIRGNQDGSIGQIILLLLLFIAFIIFCAIVDEYKIETFSLSNDVTVELSGSNFRNRYYIEANVELDKAFVESICRIPGVASIEQQNRYLLSYTISGCFVEDKVYAKICKMVKELLAK